MAIIVGAGMLVGTAEVDAITSLDGDDTLDGGIGVDSLVGGLGDNLYLVDSTADRVVERANGGVDTISAEAGYKLPPNVENLILSGTAGISGIGNVLDNTIIGNTGGNELKGRGGEDALFGGSSEDVLNGGVGNDRLVGGRDDDTLIWDPADVKVGGGAGIDTLRVTGSAALNLATVSNAKIAGIEIIDLAGTNTLTLAAADVLAISATTDTLRVDGGAGDAVDAGSGWTRIANITIGSQTYAQYTKGGATLQVDTDVDRGGIAVSELPPGVAGGDDAKLDAGAGNEAQETRDGPTPQGGNDVDHSDIAVPELQLDALDGTNGFRLWGEASSSTGISVAAAGDVNGDGFDDLLIGAADAFFESGASYVVFGKAEGFGASFELSSLTGANGFRIGAPGNSGSELGRSVSSAGDLNGDGFADLIIGSAGFGGTTGNKSYVVFGQAGGFGAVLEFSSLTGANGFRISGEAAGDFFGRSVSAGDVNGDGFDDLIIGAGGADPNGDDASGATYVVFGHAGGYGASLELSSLTGANGFRISGEAAGDYSGGSVSAAGDVNGDGFDDLLIGASGADPHGSKSGASYVLFGQAEGFGAVLELSSLTGANGFQISGETSFDFAGVSLSAAGDVNGDGFDDLVIGASGADPNGDLSGASYVVFGQAGGFGANLDLSSLNGANGFQISGEAAGDWSGSSVSAAGDVNGDGIDDVLVGAANADPNGDSSGASYVVFGRAEGFAASLDLSSLTGANGFQISGETSFDFAGASVSAAGDVNGDGFDDLLVGALGAERDGNNYYWGWSTGASYVVFGSDFSGAVTHEGTAEGETLTGTGGADVIVSGQGDDTLIGNGGADVFRGGEGDDAIVIADTSFLDIDGGNGADTLALSGSGIMLDLTAISDSKMAGLEVVSIAGSGDNTLTLSLRDLLNLSDTSNALRVNGDAGDSVIVADGTWADGGISDNYHLYTLGAATLRIDTDIASVTIAT